MRRLNLASDRIVIKGIYRDNEPCGQIPESPQNRAQILIVIAFLSFAAAGAQHERERSRYLPLAKQYADPTWISGDWYLNQPLLPAAVPSFVWQAR